MTATLQQGKEYRVLLVEGKSFIGTYAGEVGQARGNTLHAFTVSDGTRRVWSYKIDKAEEVQA